MNIIDCKKIRDNMMELAKAKVQSITKTMKLVVIQVEGDGASDIYVRNKKKACEKVGILFEHIKFKRDIDFETLSKVIKSCNSDVSVTGIMLQLPLPDHLKPYEQDLINLIDWKKDVDGLTTENVGRLWTNQQCIEPCTAKGIMELIPYDLKGKTVGLIGRSNLIGKPLTKMVLDKDGTVIVCHSKTQGNALSTLIENSDIVVLATGNGGVYGPSLFKYDTVIIDAGISKNEEGKVCGDFWIPEGRFNDYNITYTPVPGGVGIITVAQLMLNIVKAYELQYRLI